MVLVRLIIFPFFVMDFFSPDSRGSCCSWGREGRSAMQFARALISRATRNSGERGDWEEGTPFEVGIPLVHGVAVCVKGSSREGPFDLEWQDERSPPVAPDGITGSVTVPTVTGLVAKFHSIVFGDNQLSSQQPLVLHFQMKHDRFAMRRVTLSVDSKGQLTNFTVKDGAGKEPISFSHARALMVTLQDMCSGDDAFGLVRPPMWSAPACLLSRLHSHTLCNASLRASSTLTLVKRPQPQLQRCQICLLSAVG